MTTRFCDLKRHQFIIDIVEMTTLKMMMYKWKKRKKFLRERTMERLKIIGMVYTTYRMAVVRKLRNK